MLDFKVKLYTLSGEVSAKLVPRGHVSLTDNQVKIVKRFQSVAFGDVLACTEPWMKDDSESQSPVLLPLKDGRFDDTVFAPRHEVSLETVIMPRLNANSMKWWSSKSRQFFVVEVMGGPVPCTPKTRVNKAALLCGNKGHDSTYAELYQMEYGLTCTDMNQV